MKRVDGIEGVEKGLDDLEKRLAARMYRLSLAYALEMESYAKQNAPWTDQTGHARGGLFARAKKMEDGAVIVIGHTMSYGVQLELARDGKYAILEPTIKAFRPKFIDDITEVVEGAKKNN